MTFIQCKNNFLKSFTKLPLIGNLANCSFENHLSAIGEFLITCIFSFLPILLSYVVEFAMDHSTTFFSSIHNNITNGELLLYTTSLLSPILYIVLRKRKDNKTFPDKLTHIIFYFFVVFAASLIFGLKRANVKLDPLSINWIQNICFIIGIGLFYFVLVFNHSLSLNPAEMIRSQEDEFSNAVSAHRRDI
jgi:hypothetical protein